MGPSGPSGPPGLAFDPREFDPFWQPEANPLAGSLVRPTIPSARSPEMGADFLRGIGQSFTTDVLGLPVDAATAAINLGLAGAGVLGRESGLLSTDQLPRPIAQPIGGSEWLAEALGWPNSPSASAGRFAGGFAGMQPEHLPGPGTLPMLPVGLARVVSREAGLPAKALGEADIVGQFGDSGQFNSPDLRYILEELRNYSYLAPEALDTPGMPMWWNRAQPARLQNRPSPSSSVYAWAGPGDSNFYHDSRSELLSGLTMARNPLLVKGDDWLARYVPYVGLERNGPTFLDPHIDLSPLLGNINYNSSVYGPLFERLGLFNSGVTPKFSELLQAYLTDAQIRKTMPTLFDAQKELLNAIDPTKSTLFAKGGQEKLASIFRMPPDVLEATRLAPGHAVTLDAWNAELARQLGYDAIYGFDYPDWQSHGGLTEMIDLRARQLPGRTGSYAGPVDEVLNPAFRGISQDAFENALADVDVPTLEMLAKESNSSINRGRAWVSPPKEQSPVEQLDKYGMLSDAKAANIFSPELAAAIKSGLADFDFAKAPDLVEALATGDSEYFASVAGKHIPGLAEMPEYKNFLGMLDESEIAKLLKKYDIHGMLGNDSDIPSDILAVIKKNLSELLKQKEFLSELQLADPGALVETVMDLIPEKFGY